MSREHKSPATRRNRPASVSAIKRFEFALAQLVVQERFEIARALKMEEKPIPADFGSHHYVTRLDRLRRASAVRSGFDESLFRWARQAEIITEPEKRPFYLRDIRGCNWLRVYEIHPTQFMGILMDGYLNASKYTLSNGNTPIVSDNDYLREHNRMLTKNLQPALALPVKAAAVTALGANDISTRPRATSIGIPSTPLTKTQLLAAGAYAIIVQRDALGAIDQEIDDNRFVIANAERLKRSPYIAFDEEVIIRDIERLMGKRSMIDGDIIDDISWALDNLPRVNSVLDMIARYGFSDEC